MVHPHVWTRSLTLPFTVILPFQPQMNRLPLIPSQAISHTTPHSWFISHLDCWKSVFHCSPWLQDLPVLLCLLLFLFSHSVMYNSLWLPWTKTHQGSLSFTISQSLIKFMYIESMMSSNHHPLSPSSTSALNLSQHQGLFQWAISSHQMAKVLELQLQHQSCQWIFRADL